MIKIGIIIPYAWKYAQFIDISLWWPYKWSDLTQEL